VVGQLEDLVEEVRDVEERRALLGEAAYGVEDDLALVVGQRRGGLVHDDELAPPRAPAGSPPSADARWAGC
jgi:hypothetical protein